MLLGIDVSAAQSATFPWKAVAAQDKVTFVVCKAGESTNADATFTKHVPSARAAGLVTGSYFVLHPSVDPVKQAEAYARIALGKTELPPAMDFELPQYLEQVKAHGAAAIMRAGEAFVERTAALWGRPVLIYTYPWFYKGMLGDPDSQVFASHLLWMAGYPAPGSTESGKVTAPPFVPAPWRTRNEPWSMWQFDGDKGKKLTCGIDVDFDYVRDLASLQELCAMTRDATVLPPAQS